MRSKSIIYRETYNQHHDSPGGEWPHSLGKSQCTPITYGRDAWNSHMWREKIVARVLHKLNITVIMTNSSNFTNPGPDSPNPHIFWVPTAESTRNLYRFHSNVDGKCNDATHICHAPPIWAPVWEGLGKIMKLPFLKELPEPSMSNEVSAIFEKL